MDEFEHVIQHTLERLYENEQLRSNLTDTEARVVLNWAENWLQSQIAAADNETRAAQIAQGEYARVRQAVNVMNALGAQKDGLTLTQAVAALESQVKPEQAMPRELVFKLLTEMLSTLWRTQE